MKTKLDPKSQTTKTVIIAKKKINTAEQTEPVETESREIPLPMKKLVLKNSSVSEQEEPEPELETESIVTEEKSAWNGFGKFAIIAICAGAICGLLLAIGIGKNSTATKNSISDSDEEATPTEITSEIVESQTEFSTESTTEETTDNIVIIDPDKPMIALTYDDGPALGSSEKIVDILKQYGAHATFFLVGNNITEETGKIIQQEFEAGCEIGNHTQSHQNLKKLDVDSGMLQLKNCDDKICEYIGEKATLVRPPYGAYDDEIREADKRVFVYWSLESSDWKWDDADKIYEVVMENISDGDIVLMHDIHEETAKASEKLIPDLIDMGYQLVTVSELMYYRNLQAEDGMVLFNVHPETPLYNSLYGTTEFTDNTEKTESDEDEPE